MRFKLPLSGKPAVSYAVGLVFAIIAGLLVLGFLSNVIRGDPGGELIDVPTAGVDIRPGTVVSSRLMASTRVARRYLVPGTILRRASITGARALRFIGRGEPFTSTALARRGSPGALASRIPSDLRAYSLRLGATSAAGADICPGDRVDVLSTSTEVPRTVTLLTGRLVLTVGEGGERGGEGPETGSPAVLTLLVTPSEAEMLAQAECTGVISVSLCPAAE